MDVGFTIPSTTARSIMRAAIAHTAMMTKVAQRSAEIVRMTMTCFGSPARYATMHDEVATSRMTTSDTTKPQTYVAARFILAFFFGSAMGDQNVDSWSFTQQEIYGDPGPEVRVVLPRECTQSEIRKQRNRVAAAASRQRKKDQVASLEARVAQLEAVVLELHRENEQLKRMVTALSTAGMNWA